MNGFQQSIRLEMPDNMKLTSVYPVSTKTNFACVAGEGEAINLPFPVQNADDVAKAMVAGIEKGKALVYPCKLWPPSKVLFSAFKGARALYWNIEIKNFKRYVASRKKKK